MRMAMTDLPRKLLAGAVAWGVVGAALAGCGTPRIAPVEIYPEDACATCRMAFSDQRFASEVIDTDGGVFKFDDIACMESFLSGRAETVIAAAYVKDFETKTWISRDRAVIVTTSVASPMGSGKIAFADSSRAFAFQKDHPVLATGGAEEKPGCCADGND